MATCAIENADLIKHESPGRHTIESELIEGAFGTDSVDTLVITQQKDSDGKVSSTAIFQYPTGNILRVFHGTNFSPVVDFLRTLDTENSFIIKTLVTEMNPVVVEELESVLPGVRIVLPNLYIGSEFEQVASAISDHTNCTIQSPRCRSIWSFWHQSKKPIELTDMTSVRNLLIVLRFMLKAVYFFPDREKMRQTLRDFHKMAALLQDSTMNQFRQKLQFLEYAVLNHAEDPISTDVLENMETRIQQQHNSTATSEISTTFELVA